MSTIKFSTRIPTELHAQLDAAAAERGGSGAKTAILVEALKAYFRSADEAVRRDEMEARVAATLNGVRKDIALVRNESQIGIALLDSFIRTYLVHTPPVPREAVEDAAVSAQDRYEKLMRRTPELLQGDNSILTKLAEVLGEGNG